MSEDAEEDLRRRLQRVRSASRRPSPSRKHGSATERSRSRSRRRSRSRCGSRRRSQSRESFRLEGSTSRELYTEDAKLQQITSLVKDQQEFLLDLLSEHKAEVDVKLQSRQRRFSSKQIEKQYEINAGFLKLVTTAKALLDSADYKRTATVLEDLSSQLETHAEDLVIADTSPHGWLAVAKVRAGTDLPKLIRKKLEQVDRELSAQKNRSGGPNKKFFGFPKESQGPLLRRDGRRITSEEALSYASKQLRAGICTHCKKAYHYYRQRPTFWQQVQDSREEAAKKSTN